MVVGVLKDSSAARAISTVLESLLEIENNSCGDVQGGESSQFKIATLNFLTRWRRLLRRPVTPSEYGNLESADNELSVAVFWLDLVKDRSWGRCKEISRVRWKREFVLQVLINGPSSD